MLLAIMATLPRQLLPHTPLTQIHPFTVLTHIVIPHRY